MIWIHPTSVTLFGKPVLGVKAVTVSLTSRDVIEEWTDGGPYAVFADAADVSAEIVIEREATADAPGLAGSPRPGELGVLTLTAAASRGSAHGETVTATVVVTAVRHALQGGGGPSQRVVFRAVSEDGLEHPVSITESVTK